MHFADVFIPIAAVAALIAGAVIGTRLTASGVRLMRAVVLAAVCGFTGLLVAAAVIARSGIGGDALRLIVFWALVAMLLPAVAGLAAGVTLLLRPGLRRSGLILALLALIPIPIFVLVTFLGRVLAGA